MEIRNGPLGFYPYHECNFCDYSICKRDKFEAFRRCHECDYDLCSTCVKKILFKNFEWSKKQIELKPEIIKDTLAGITI